MALARRGDHRRAGRAERLTRSSSAARRSNRSHSSRQARPLTDLDQRILSLLSHHRVLTQNQLAAIEPSTPARTLRYRCAQLAQRGLLGRTRPYRERGSAPHHLWPTRRGEAIACGGPPPRGGERHEPNPLFLAHAAGLSEIYVALETRLPPGVELARFEREGEAREPFTVWGKRDQRAIAPDVFIEIADRDGGALLAFIELDMGSMSHRRLKQKAAGYAEYAKPDAWRERHRFCPALLFITTTEKRARSFLTAMHKNLGRDALLLTCACDLARRLDRIAAEPAWLLGTEDEDAVDLLAGLREARRPFDEERKRVAAERREEEAERERLRTDPEALRGHLRYWHGRWEIGRSASRQRRPLRSPSVETARRMRPSAGRCLRSGRSSPTRCGCTWAWASRACATGAPSTTSPSAIERSSFASSATSSCASARVRRCARLATESKPASC